MSLLKTNMAKKGLSNGTWVQQVKTHTQRVHANTHAHSLSSITPYCLLAPRVEPSSLSLTLSLSLLSLLMLGRPQGWGMCESHVSNPQTVGKCCSLLNSLLPPSLHPSMLPSLALSFSWTTHQASTLPCCNPVQVSVHASVCARACLTAHRKWVQIACQRRSAWNCRFLQTVSMPTPSPPQHTHSQPPQLPVRNNQDGPRRREGAACLSFSVCLSLYLICLFLFDTNADIFSLCVLCVCCFEELKWLHTVCVWGSPASKIIASNNSFFILKF